MVGVGAGVAVLVAVGVVVGIGVAVGVNVPVGVGVGIGDRLGVGVCTSSVTRGDSDGVVGVGVASTSAVGVGVEEGRGTASSWPAAHASRARVTRLRSTKRHRMGLPFSLSASGLHRFHANRCGPGLETSTKCQQAHGEHYRFQCFQHLLCSGPLLQRQFHMGLDMLHIGA